MRKSSLEECLSDNQFLSFLGHDDVPSDLTAQRRYLSVVLIECVADLTQPHYKVRRLHLVIVDLWRPWKIHKSQVRSLTDQLHRLQPGLHADNTAPMMPMRSKTPLHGRRFVYSYSLDGSDFPCYLVWPWRTDSNSFFCWNRNLVDMWLLTKQDFSTRWTSAISMMALAFVQRLAFALPLLSHLIFMRMSCPMT